MSIPRPVSHNWGCDYRLEWDRKQYRLIMHHLHHDERKTLLQQPQILQTNSNTDWGCLENTLQLICTLTPLTLNGGPFQVSLERAINSNETKLATTQNAPRKVQKSTLNTPSTTFPPHGQRCKYPTCRKMVWLFGINDTFKPSVTLPSHYIAH